MPKGGIVYLIMVFAPWEAIIKYNVLSPMGVFVLGGIYHTINRQLHAFSCNLGIIAFPTGFNCTRYARAITSLLVMQLFPNYTQKHVITYTNLM